MKYLLFFLIVSLCNFAVAGDLVKGINHLGLSVTDLKASEDFFIKYGEFTVFNRDEKYPSSFLNNGSITITLWQVANPKSAIKFDRKNNVGLHHVAFTVSSDKALNDLYDKLKQDDSVNIEFSPELMGRGPTKHMMVYEPSGNRVEFVFRPASK